MPIGAKAHLPPPIHRVCARGRSCCHDGLARWDVAPFGEDHCHTWFALHDVRRDYSGGHPPLRGSPDYPYGHPGYFNGTHAGQCPVMETRE